MLDSAVIAPEEIRPLARAEYERMVALGWFDDERIELLYGALISMSPQGPRHAAVLRRLNKLLVPALLGSHAARAEVQVQAPLALSNDSEPEPDMAVVMPEDDPQAHPTNALLVIEVADTSLRKDRDIKARLYAACGIPDYWLVNLVDDVIEVYTAPRDGAYQSMTRRGRGERIVPVAFPDIAVPVAEVLGPARNL